MFGAVKLKMLLQIDVLILGMILGVIFVIFELDNSSLLYIDNKKKFILVLGESVTQGVDDTRTTAEPKYSINFKRLKTKFC